MGVLYSNYVDGYAMGMFFVLFSFGTACGAIMLVAATGTTISCSLGRWYMPVLCLSYLMPIVCTPKDYFCRL
jgi:hypothetical protein